MAIITKLQDPRDKDNSRQKLLVKCWKTKGKWTSDDHLLRVDIPTSVLAMKRRRKVVQTQTWSC
jgi:hypothetical protein